MDGEVKYAGFWIRALALFLDYTLLITFYFLVINLFKLDQNEPSFFWFANIVTNGYFFIMSISKHQATLGKKILKIKICTTDFQRMGWLRAGLRVFVPWLTFMCIWVISTFMIIEIAQSDMVVELSDYERGIKTLQIAAISLVSVIISVVWYGMAGWTKEKTALHDKIFGTRVVYASSLSEKEAA